MRDLYRAARDAAWVVALLGIYLLVPCARYWLATGRDPRRG